MADEPAGTGTGEQTGATLDSLLADQKFTDRLLAGGLSERREFDAAIAAKSAKSEGDHIDHIINGTAQAPIFQTLTGTELGVRDQMTAAAALKDTGVNDAVIRQALEGKPVSKEEYQLVKNHKADLLGDKDFVTKYLSGDRSARRTMTLVQVALAAGYK